MFFSLLLVGVGWLLERIFRRWKPPQKVPDASPKKRIAVIGGGVSGLATAHIFQKRGHEVIVYEKSDQVGGVWSRTYPGTSLQNSYHQYHITDLSWPKSVNLHPTCEEILKYYSQAVKTLKLDVRLNHTVEKMERVGENEEKWRLVVNNEEGSFDEEFDYAVVAVGQYSDRKRTLQVDGQENFKGRIITEVDIESLSELSDKEVVVVGFGKSALDMTVFAHQNNAKKVHHVFRTPRWGIPQHLFGIHYTKPFFSRFGSIMMTSWVQPPGVERILHTHLKFVVDGFWGFIQKVFAYHRDKFGKGKPEEFRKRLEVVTPTHRLPSDLRSATPLMPNDYYDYVAQGVVEPYRGEVSGFTENEIVLSDGLKIKCDLVVASIGSETPTFPFLPADARKAIGDNTDGVQLYRHVVHPDIPNLGFAGYNHGFLQLPVAEVGALWLSALISGELELPSRDEMMKSIDHITKWKREHINHEPSLLCGVNTRFQQYLDVMLLDLGMSPYRKLPNVIAEIFGRYGASDYATLVEEYQEKLYNQVSRPISVLT